MFKNKNALFEFEILPQYMQLIVNVCMTFLLVTILILSTLFYLEKLGYLASRKDEASLITAFKVADLRYGHPILIAKKKIKKGDVVVTVRDFYTYIPKSKWEDRKSDIEDCLNVCLVKPYIEYGGRNKNKSHRIVLYSVPDRKLKDRGALYDND